MEKKLISISINNLINYIIVFSFFIGCNRVVEKVDFKIINNTNSLLKEIKISNGINNIYIENLDSKQTKNIVLEFKNVPKIDGGYQLNYMSNSKNNIKNFGYYSNGIPIDKSFYIDIRKDTVFIK